VIDSSLLKFISRKAYNWLLKNINMKIKVFEEDFKVTEITNLKFNSERGRYAYFLLRKKGKNTSSAVRDVARRLRINTKTIGYAGNKDKRALTEQYISIPIDAIQDVKVIENLNIENTSLKFVGYGDQRITLGDLKGNKFEIIVRELGNKKEIVLGKIKNYFGGQRFGKDNFNVFVGMAILKRDFKGACKLLGIGVKDNKFVNALKEVDIRLLRLYVCAYQSYLWNEIAKRIEGLDELEIIGFLTEFQNKEVEVKYINLLERDGLKQEDFIIKQFKELSMEGTKRRLIADVKNFSSSWGEDENCPGKNKCVLSFELGKGSYATVLVDAIFLDF